MAPAFLPTRLTVFVIFLSLTTCSGGPLFYRCPDSKFFNVSACRCVSCQPQCAPEQILWRPCTTFADIVCYNEDEIINQDLSFPWEDWLLNKNVQVSIVTSPTREIYQTDELADSTTASEEHRDGGKYLIVAGVTAGLTSLTALIAAIVLLMVVFKRKQRRNELHSHYVEGTHKFTKYSDTQNICCNHSKIWTMWLCHRVMSPNYADGIANSVDPDQTAPLIWVCTVCPGISVRKLRISTVMSLSVMSLSHSLVYTYTHTHTHTHTHRHTHTHTHTNTQSVTMFCKLPSKLRV